MRKRWVSRHRANATIIVAVGVLGAALAVAPSAGATTVTGLAVVSGELPAAATAASAATVYVEGIPDLASVAVGDMTTDVVLASEQVTSGTAFTVTIPDSAAAESVVSPTAGTINFHILVVSASGASDTYGTVAASISTPGSISVGTVNAYQRALTAFSGDSIPSSTPDANGCGWYTDARDDDWATRIGEMHVIGGTGVKETATYSYEQQADSVISVGLSETTGNSWVDGGTVSVTNTTDTYAAETEGPNYLRYIDAHLDYAEQTLIGVCAGEGEMRVLPVAWDGDVIQGSNEPPGNPYGGCLNDPNGYAELDGGGKWYHYTSTGVSYDTIATDFGFTFSGHTGYSATNGFEYDNPKGAVTTYLCSTVSPVGSWHVIYNTLG